MSHTVLSSSSSSMSCVQAVLKRISPSSIAAHCASPELRKATVVPERVPDSGSTRRDRYTSGRSKDKINTFLPVAACVLVQTQPSFYSSPLPARNVFIELQPENNNTRSSIIIHKFGSTRMLLAVQGWPAATPRASNPPLENNRRQRHRSKRNPLGRSTVLLHEYILTHHIGTKCAGSAANKAALSASTKLNE